MNTQTNPAPQAEIDLVEESHQLFEKLTVDSDYFPLGAEIEIGMFLESFADKIRADERSHILSAEREKVLAEFRSTLAIILSNHSGQGITFKTRMEILEETFNSLTSLRVKESEGTK